LLGPTDESGSSRWLKMGCLYGVDPGTLVRAEPHNIEGYHALAIVIINDALRGRKGIVSVAFAEEK
jgi:hypothetical protein